MSTNPPDDAGSPGAVYGCSPPPAPDYVDEYTPLYTLQGVLDLLETVAASQAKVTHPIKQRAVAEYREAVEERLRTVLSEARHRAPVDAWFGPAPASGFRRT